MPYTFSHIGFILPIKKKCATSFSTTGLVFGSLAPDYDILFRFTNNRYHIFQYDLETIFLIIFPLALLSAYLFHLFCRAIIIQHSPKSIQENYLKYTDVSLHRIFYIQFFKLTISILIAIFLHLLLDFLCHFSDAYATKIYMYNFTNSELIANLSYYLSIYFLPILFSLVGFILLYKYEIKGLIKKQPEKINTNKIFFFSWIALVTIFISILKIILTKKETDFFIDLIAISITSSFMMATYLVCFFYFLMSKSKKTVHV